jgi:hypothetical protein
MLTRSSRPSTAALVSHLRGAERGLYSGLELPFCYPHTNLALELRTEHGFTIWTGAADSLQVTTPTLFPPWDSPRIEQ